MSKNPEQFSPKEAAKIEKERTLSEAELLKSGAEYEVDKPGNKRLVDVPQGEINKIAAERDKGIESRLKREATETALAFGEQEKHIVKRVREIAVEELRDGQFKNIEGLIGDTGDPEIDSFRRKNNKEEIIRYGRGVTKGFDSTGHMVAEQNIISATRHPGSRGGGLAAGGPYAFEETEPVKRYLYDERGRIIAEGITEKEGTYAYFPRPEKMTLYKRDESGNVIEKAIFELSQSTLNEEDRLSGVAINMIRTGQKDAPTPLYNLVGWTRFEIHERRV